jgi:DNA-binding GntR family transcriptional regulator
VKLTILEAIVSGLAVVRSLDGISATEQVCADLRTAIQYGRLAPGQVISLRELADRHRVRINTLILLLGGLERDRLLTLRGGVAIVAPLSHDDLSAILRLRRVVEPHMLMNACHLITPSELDRLAKALPLVTTVPDDQAFSDAMAALDEGLSRPAATSVDRRAMANLQLAIMRYQVLGWDAMPADSGDTLTNHLASCHDLIERMRSGNANAVREAVLRTIDDSEVTARLSLEVEYDVEPPRLALVHSVP